MPYFWYKYIVEQIKIQKAAVDSTNNQKQPPVFLNITTGHQTISRSPKSSIKLFIVYCPFYPRFHKAIYCTFWLHSAFSFASNYWVINYIYTEFKRNLLKIFKYNKLRVQFNHAIFLHFLWICCKLRKRNPNV